MTIKKLIQQYITLSTALVSAENALAMAKANKPDFVKSVYFIDDAELMLERVRAIEDTQNIYDISLQNMIEAENALLLVFEKYFKDSIIIAEHNRVEILVSAVIGENDKATINIKSR